MIVFMKKIFIMISLSVFLQSCSTAVTVVDKTASGVFNVVGTTVHLITCPVTKKKCFD
tara:strand:+ start:163 stop:336 length:174 start_codon:yes stop_codon:yes gene_type:complete